jgi:hypothetical protein
LQESSGQEAARSSAYQQTRSIIQSLQIFADEAKPLSEMIEMAREHAEFTGPILKLLKELQAKLLAEQNNRVSKNTCTRVRRFGCRIPVRQGPIAACQIAAALFPLSLCPTTHFCVLTLATPTQANRRFALLQPIYCSCHVNYKYRTIKCPFVKTFEPETM